MEAELKQTRETATQQESSTSCHRRLRVDAEVSGRVCRAKNRAVTRVEMAEGGLSEDQLRAIIDGVVERLKAPTPAPGEEDGRSQDEGTRVPPRSPAATPEGKRHE